MMVNDTSVALLKEILTWTRAASFHSVKSLLEKALPDAKSQMAFQMLDGTKSLDQVRIACKVSPNAIGALAQKCVSMGLMEVTEEKKRIRLFDLNDFDLMAPQDENKGRTK
jgi:hypothetical protein